jgi:DNA-binding response OmpR family regulator
MRVLLAENDEQLASAIARVLRREALTVDIADDGATTLEKVRTVPYDVLMSNRDLPVVDGDDVCRQLTRSGSLTRILGALF